MLAPKKIDNSPFKTFGMVIASFIINNKDGKSCFLEEIFLSANISINIAFEIFFLILSNVQTNFIN